MKKQKETDVFEIWLDDKKIDDLIKKLIGLKKSKEHVHFDDKKKNHVILAHKEGEI